MKLYDLVNVNELNELVENKYISRVSHPDDTVPYDIYSYTNSGEYFAATNGWTDTLRRCRGLIVNRDTNDVVARPFDKFFNLGTQITYSEVLDAAANKSELDSLAAAGVNVFERISPSEMDRIIKSSGDNEPDCEGGAPSAADAIVAMFRAIKVNSYDKLDGVYSVCYRLPNGETAFASKGSMDSVFAHGMSDWCKANHPDFSAPEGVTMLFEYVGPKSHIIVDYPNEELVLLGARDIDSGKVYLPEEAAQLFGWNGRCARKLVNNGTLLDAISTWQEDKCGGIETNSDFTEGQVVTIAEGKHEGMKVKLKTDFYLSLVSVSANISEGRVIELFYDKVNRVPHDASKARNFAADLPDELRYDFDKVLGAVYTRYSFLFRATRDLYTQARGIAKARGVKFEQLRHMDNSDRAAAVGLIRELDFIRVGSDAPMPSKLRKGLAGLLTTISDEHVLRSGFSSVQVDLWRKVYLLRTLPLDYFEGSVSICAPD